MTGHPNAAAAATARLDAGGTVTAYDAATLAQALLDIADGLVPDTFFASDTRLQLARVVLAHTGELNRPGAPVLGLHLDPITVGTHWTIDDGASRESWIVLESKLHLAGEVVWQLNTREFRQRPMPDQDDPNRAYVMRSFTELDIELSGPAEVPGLGVVDVDTRGSHMRLGTQAWRIGSCHWATPGRWHMTLWRDPEHDLPAAAGAEVSAP